MRTGVLFPARLSRPPASAIALMCAVAWAACAPAAETDQQMESAEPAAIAEGVEAAFETFIDAWEAEDADAALATFTADAIAFDPVPPVKFAGTGGIRSWISGAFETLDGISITTSEMTVQTHGPVAWSTARYVFEATPAEGEPISDEGYLSMVWLLQDDGSYKATLFHASNIPEEPMGEGP